MASRPPGPILPRRRRVVICEAKPSPARKFLMAGKSGLNITKDEDLPTLIDQYDAANWLGPMLQAFGPREVIIFSRALGQEVESWKRFAAALDTVLRTS